MQKKSKHVVLALFNLQGLNVSLVVPSVSGGTILDDDTRSGFCQYTIKIGHLIYRADIQHARASV